MTPETPITLINVFTVGPHDQTRLIELLTEATERFVRHAPGFISARLHRSVDGTKVTMVAEWQSMADYEAMRADARPLPYLQEALKFSRFEPGMYKVVRAFTPPAVPKPERYRYPIAASPRSSRLGRPRAPTSGPPSRRRSCLHEPHSWTAASASRLLAERP
jgi:quinol monooxygenase YgiN